MTGLDKFILFLCVYIQECLYVSGVRGYIHNCDTGIYSIYRNELNTIVMYSIIMVKGNELLWLLPRVFVLLVAQRWFPARRCLQETIHENDNKFVITRMWTVMFYANLVWRQPHAVIIDFVETLACCYKMADRGDLFINIVCVHLLCLLVDSK